MSQENLEIVRRVWDAVERQDTEAVLSLYAEDVEYDFSRSPFQSAGIGQPVYRGHDALRGMFRERYDDWAQIEDHCHELIEAGDEVISVVTSRGRGRGSGIEAERTHVGLWSLREGRVVRVRWLGTLDEALAAAGQSEQRATPPQDDRVAASDEDSSSIAAIRRRPGMWVGTTGSRGVMALLMEVVGNSVDQLLAGKARHLAVTFHADGSFSVADDGAGISLATGPDGVSVLERAFTEVRDSPTMDGHHPHVHLSFGLGLAPVSALSESVTVQVTNDDGSFEQSFARGQVASPLRQVSPAGRRPSGTTVTVLPDREIFEGALDLEDALRRLRTLAALTEGLSVDVVVEWIHHGEATDLPSLVTELAGYEPGPVVELSARDGANRVDMALSFSRFAYRDHEPRLRTFCNFRELHEGGLTPGLEEGLRRIFGERWTALQPGLTAVIHVLLLDPEFSGPTRTRLDSPEGVELVASALAEHLPAALAGHPGLLEQLEARL